MRNQGIDNHFLGYFKNGYHQFFVRFALFCKPDKNDEMRLLMKNGEDEYFVELIDFQ